MFKPNPRRNQIMKKTIILLTFLTIAIPAFTQVERGDTEVSFLGYYNTIVGEDVDPNASGFLQISYGKYLTPNLLVGIAPNLRFYASEDQSGDMEVSTDISGSIFFNLNFSTSSKTIPYITGQYYQFTFDIPDEAEFTAADLRMDVESVLSSLGDHEGFRPSGVTDEDLCRSMMETSNPSATARGFGMYPQALLNKSTGRLNRIREAFGRAGLATA